MVFAKGKAIPATNAPIIAKQQLLIGGDRFRIMAPFAVERTPLQKDGRTDARSIIHGKTLYVKDETLHSDDHKKM
jgi:hypothetical protein